MCLHLPLPVAAHQLLHELQHMHRTSVCRLRSTRMASDQPFSNGAPTAW